jgi:hypothetical protein
MYKIDTVGGKMVQMDKEMDKQIQNANKEHTEINALGTEAHVDI